MAKRREEHVSHYILLGILVGLMLTGVMLMSPSLTGYAIFGSSAGTYSAMGAILFFTGIFGMMLYLRERREHAQ